MPKDTRSIVPDGEILDAIKAINTKDGVNKQYVDELPTTKVYPTIEGTLVDTIKINKDNNEMIAKEIVGLQNYKVNAVGGNNPERPLIQLDENIFIGDEKNENIILNKDIIAYKDELTKLIGDLTKRVAALESK